MNAPPRPERGQQQESAPAHSTGLVEPAVPRQSRQSPAVPPSAARGGRPGVEPAGDAEFPGEPDPLEHPDPEVAADLAACEGLLRCWVRETGVVRPVDRLLTVPLPASGSELRVPVLHWSATGWHRFGPPELASAPAGAPPLDAVTLAALLSREAAGAGGGRGAGEAAALVGRVADSQRRTALFLAHRRADPGPARHGHAFLDAEQSVLFGHPLHPNPKSLEGMAGREAARCSPELRGAFRLHWLAVDRAVLASDSAWRDGGAEVPADLLAARLAGARLPVPPGMVPLPLHPWQAREVAHRPAVAELLAAGLLRDLGEHGPQWHPTSSVRTVHRPGTEAMLKLSLGLWITNSRRENLRKELHRGVEVHRLLEGGLAAELRAACGPGFDILRDPAWLAVDDLAGRPVPGLDTLLRQSPFGPEEDVLCLAALTAPRPWPGRSGGALSSRLAELVRGLVERTGRRRSQVAAEWLARYLRAVVAPVLWLDAHAGVALEAHQQNTLVLLDADGWPVGGRYRDNQGYYFRASHRAALQRRLPGIGERSDTFVPDRVADERFAYYLGINNVFGLIGAFGAQRLADEQALLAVFRAFLVEQAGRAAEPVSPLVEHLLTAETLRCKANLLTRLHGLDELTGPVDGQSVYVTVANPLAGG
ncbi:IucA/IucC family protein [Streptomyces sp. DSM 44915]|uniref:IucA/IucC family protein n=1 Tax=Streptomyces chisholmiae TaxID=3075540 RepID=A0ABU2JMG8_9ACTN|nr:IucA/IucC family protein [Streptomyces sp. DSM 44915]MDT0266178.1 IucA/IucC family protein [Streptomyces sp. DSM 44915]